MEHREIDEDSSTSHDGEVLKDEAVNRHTLFDADEAVLNLLRKVAAKKVKTESVP